MRERSRTFPRTPIVLAALCALGGSSVAQSAWTQPEGATFLQLSYQQTGPYDRLYRDGDSSIRLGREITEAALEVYGEHGLAEGLTLIGVVPLRFLDAGSLQSNPTIQPTTIESGSETTLGNVLIGVRKTLATGEVAVAGQLGLELPTGSLDRKTGLSSGLDAFTFLPTISVGRGFGDAYAQAYAGFGLRTDDYSNDWRLGVEGGYRLFERLVVAGTVDVVSSFSDGSPSQNARNLETGLYVDEQEYASYGFKGLYEVSDGFGVQAAVRGAFSGDNVPRSPFMSVGVYFRF